MRTTKPCWRKARRTKEKAPKKAAERRVQIGTVRLGHDPQHDDRDAQNAQPRPVRSESAAQRDQLVAAPEQQERQEQSRAVDEQGSLPVLLQVDPQTLPVSPRAGNGYKASLFLRSQLASLWWAPGPDSSSAAKR